MILAEHKRNGNRITYADVADAIGVHENTIYNITNNRIRSINLDTLDALCNFFMVDPEKISLWIPDGNKSEEGS